MFLLTSTLLLLMQYLFETLNLGCVYFMKDYVYICSLPEMDINNYSMRTQKTLSMEIVPSVSLLYFVNKKEPTSTQVNY